MKKTYDVLIVEDELWACEGYKNTLEQMGERSDRFKFNVDTAHDCPTAYNKLMQAINGTPYDMVFLDIRLPSTNGHNIRSGEDLGVLIRDRLPNTKLIVVTGHFEAAPLNNISDKLKPDAFVIKGDIMAKDFIEMVEKVIDNNNFFSSRIQTLMKQQLANKGVLGDLDIKILLEISNGSKMSDLVQIINLGDSAIHKHKGFIKAIFGDSTMSDRDMIMIAKEKGFI